MKRRDLLKLLGLASGSSIAGQLTGCGGGGSGGGAGPVTPSSPPPVEPVSKPNLVVLLADDQRYDSLGANGNKLVSTPNLDELANQGTNFPNAFVTTSICPVSRVSILTGQHMRRHGIQGFDTQIDSAAFGRSFPAVLRDAGWRTGFLGKWGIGEDLPTQYFDEFDGFAGQGSYFPDGEEGEHLTASIGESAGAFIEKHQASPFLLSVSFKAPHAEGSGNALFLPDPRYSDLYAAEDIPIPLTATEEDFDELPEFIRSSEGRNRWMQRFATDAEFQENVKDYYRLITGMDAVVGEIVEKLHQLNLYDNTIILFTSDNGFFLGERGLAGKWLMYEESIRVPMIIKPLASEAQNTHPIVDRMALNIDIAPTILDMLGAERPEAMQGRSLWPLMRDPRLAWRDDWYYEYRYDFDGRIPHCEGVRTESWKYVNYPDHDYRELYDLVNDPWEMHNLVQDDSHGGVVDELAARLDALSQQAG